MAGGDLLVLSRNEFRQEAVKPVGGPHPGLAELVAAIDQHPQRLELGVVAEHPQAGGADRDHGDGVRVVRVGLAVMAGIEQPSRRDVARSTGSTRVTTPRSGLFVQGGRRLSGTEECVDVG